MVISNWPMLKGEYQRPIEAHLEIINLGIKL